MVKRELGVLAPEDFTITRPFESRFRKGPMPEMTKEQYRTLDGRPLPRLEEEEKITEEEKEAFSEEFRKLLESNNPYGVN